VRSEAGSFDGVAQGHLTLRVESPHHHEDNPEEEYESTVNLPLRVRIVPTPPRHRRLLWDQFHNLRSVGVPYPAPGGKRINPVAAGGPQKISVADPGCFIPDTDP
jgi:hypothetical protein